MPVSRIATISSDVPTGRRMKMRDGFMSRCVPGEGCRPRSSAALAARLLLTAMRAFAVSLAGRLPGGAGLVAWERGATAAARCLAQQHLGAILELVGAVDDHLLAGLQSLRDHDVARIPRAERHLAHADGLVGGVDDV